MTRTLLFALLAAAPMPALAAPAVELAAGIEADEGDYGTGERVERLTVQSEVRVRSGDFMLGAALPWHRIEAPGNVVGGGGPLGLPILIDPTRPADRQVRSGVGDLRVGASWVPRAAGFALALGGEVKLPTAADGLGTGAPDLTLSAEAARTIGPVTPFASLSYTMPGDPEGYELDDALAVRGGVAIGLARGIQGSLSYAQAESMSPLVPGERQVSTGLDVGLSRRLSLGLHGSAGLSEGAPNAAVGVRVGWRLF